MKKSWPIVILIGLPILFLTALIVFVEAGLVFQRHPQSNYMTDLQDRVENQGLGFSEIQVLASDAYEHDRPCRHHHVFSAWCDSNKYKESRSSLWDSIDRKVGELIEAGDLAAVIVVFELPRLSPIRHIISLHHYRMAASEKLVALAETPSAEPHVLVTAGKIILEGKYYLQNLPQAAEYLYRAWELGDTEAAGLLANAYYRAGQAKNSYLWALRCTSPCSRSNRLDIYMKPLDPATILQVQEAATNPQFNMWPLDSTTTDS